MVAGGAIGGRSTPRRRCTSPIQACFWYVYWWPSMSPPSTMPRLRSAYVREQVRVGAQGVAEGEVAARAPPCPGWTWQWMRNVVPSTAIEPTSIGRVGGHGSGPGWSPNPRPLSIGHDAGQVASGVVAMARSTMPLPGRPGTAVLPMCSTTRSGRRSRRGRRPPRRRRAPAGPTRRTSAGSRTYGPIGRLHRPSVDCGPCDRSSAAASSRWTSAKSPTGSPAPSG